MISAESRAARGKLTNCIPNPPALQNMRAKIKSAGSYSSISKASVSSHLAFCNATMRRSEDQSKNHINRIYHINYLTAFLFQFSFSSSSSNNYHRTLIPTKSAPCPFSPFPIITSLFPTFHPSTKSQKQHYPPTHLPPQKAHSTCH